MGLVAVVGGSQREVLVAVAGSPQAVVAVAEGSWHRQRAEEVAGSCRGGLGLCLG